MSKSVPTFSRYGGSSSFSFIEHPKPREYTNVFHKVYKQFKPDEIHKILANLVGLIKELKKFDVDLHPREFYAREQAMLFAQDIYVKLKVAEFSGGRFREGIENLYFLQQKLSPIDSAAADLLDDIMIKILRITEAITSQGELCSGLRPTNWDAVIALLEKQMRERVVLAKPLVGKVLWLQLDKCLGAGGFGVVYKAWLGNSTCTVKLVPNALMPSAKHAIMDKLVASATNHPCLVKYHSTFAAEGAMVTVMEYIRGVDMSKLLRVCGWLPTKVLRILIAQLGVAIQYLHFSGFIHRDIKPENIMILTGCRLKLIDFDTAKACIGKFHNKSMPTYYERTKLEILQPEIAGTYPYTPPECLTNKGYGRTMDWWALGVTTYQFATGQLPFPPDSQEHLQARITTAAFKWPKTKVFEQNLKYLVNACLRINPKFRLCSGHYSEFQKHPFFEGVDWQSIESAPVLIQYDPIYEVYAQELRFKNTLQQELLTPTVSMNRFTKPKPKSKPVAETPKSLPPTTLLGRARKSLQNLLNGNKDSRLSPGKQASSPPTKKQDDSEKVKASGPVVKKEEAVAPPAQPPAAEAPPAADENQAQHQRVANLMGLISPTSSPGTEAKRQRLFGDLTELQDLEEQVNIYTFSSWAFSRAMEALERGEMPHSRCLEEPGERVVIEDEKQPYAFEVFLKKDPESDYPAPQTL